MWHESAEGSREMRKVLLRVQRPGLDAGDRGMNGAGSVLVLGGLGNKGEEEVLGLGFLEEVKSLRSPGEGGGGVGEEHPGRGNRGKRRKKGSL